MHAYNRVLTILGLACIFVFYVSVKVKLFVPLLCVCVHFAWKGRPWNDLHVYCVGWDIKPFSLTHSLTCRGYEISHPYPYPQIFRGYRWIYP